MGDGRNKPARRCFSRFRGTSRANASTALLPTVIRWWEWLRAWYERHRVGFDATDGRNGGAVRTVWETLLEMERFDCRAGEMDQGAITLVLDLAEAFYRVSLPVVWSRRADFNFSHQNFSDPRRGPHCDTDQQGDDHPVRLVPSGGASSPTPSPPCLCTQLPKWPST